MLFNSYYEYLWSKEVAWYIVVPTSFIKNAMSYSFIFVFYGCDRLITPHLLLSLHNNMCISNHLSCPRMIASFCTAFQIAILLAIID